MSPKIWSLVLLTLWCSYVVSSEKNVICYYGTWATYRWGVGKFDVDNINPFLCTHLIYTFVGIDRQGTVISLDTHLDLPSGRDNFAKLNGLKQQNPHLKTLLAVGGFNEGSGKYSVMAANPTLRKNFIKTALEMTLTHGFDGFDLDWEYPSRRDSVYGAADIDNFSELVKELKKEFRKHDLLVTAAVSSVKDNSALSYNIAKISKHLDLIHLMTYDMYGAWNPETGHNAPLHRGEGYENISRENYYSVDAAIEYWLAQGAPPEKLAIGVPFYGRSFTLANANVNGVRAPASGAGIAGPHTVTAGTLGYNELCNIIQTQQWDIRHDSLAKVPYAVQGRNWVSYDDAGSITEKVKWGLQKNITSIMIWSIETDDFHGICGEEFPLLKAINRALGRNVNGDKPEDTEAITKEPIEVTTQEFNKESPSATTEEPNPDSTLTVTEASITEKPVISTAAPVIDSTPEQSKVCKHAGIIANPADCKSFFMCIADASGDLYPVKFFCPDKLYFNTEYLACDYADAVKCLN